MPTAMIQARRVLFCMAIVLWISVIATMTATLDDGLRGLVALALLIGAALVTVCFLVCWTGIVLYTSIVEAVTARVIEYFESTIQPTGDGFQTGSRAHLARAISAVPINPVRAVYGRVVKAGDDEADTGEIDRKAVGGRPDPTSTFELGRRIGRREAGAPGAAAAT